MNRALIGVIVLIVAAAALVGIAVSGGSTDPTPAPTVAQPTSTASTASASSKEAASASSVTIADFAFSPSTLKVKKGSTVTWTNQDSTKHNVVADGPAIAGGLPSDSQLLAKGETFRFTFDKVGTFKYKCDPHPEMKATVEVTE